MSDVMEDVSVEVDLDTLIEDLTGDTRTHMINPVDNMHIQRHARKYMSAQEISDYAKEYGMEVTALCGYTWVPKRNVEAYPVCETCSEIAHRFMAEDGE